MHRTLDKFTKGEDNWNLILVNQRASYNKVGLGYELKNDSKSVSKTCHANRTYKLLDMWLPTQEEGKGWMMCLKKLVFENLSRLKLELEFFLKICSD